jgi:hypothetical protein
MSTHLAPSIHHRTITVCQKVTQLCSYIDIVFCSKHVKGVSHSTNTGGDVADFHLYLLGNLDSSMTAARMSMKFGRPTKIHPCSIRAKLISNRTRTEGDVANSTSAILLRLLSAIPFLSCLEKSVTFKSCRV